MGKKSHTKNKTGGRQFQPADVEKENAVPVVAGRGRPTWFTAVRKQYLFLFIFATALYVNTLDMGYACDDALMITQNKFTLKGVEGIKEIFSNDAFVGLFGKNNLLPGGRYRPLSQVMFAVEYQLFGLNPFVGHLINVIFYALLGLLIFHVLRKLMPGRDSDIWYLSIPFIATALFIAHPMHTEVVANIKGRDELMSLGGCFGALYFFLRYTDGGKPLNLLWGLILFFLAILSKENALAWVAVIPVSLYFFRKNAFRRIAVTLIPLVAGILGYLLMRILVLGYLMNEVRTTELLNDPFLEASTVEKYATILHTWGKYFLLLLFPHPLTHDYYPKQIPLVTFSDIRAWVPLLITLASGVIALVYLKRKHLVSFAILFFWLSFIMSSNLLVNIGAFMNERFMFASILGFTLIVAWILADRLPRWIRNKQTWKKVALTALVLILAGYTAKTLTRNRVWKNDFVLFTTDVNISYNSAKCNTSAGGKLAEYADSTNNPVQRQQYLERAVGYLTKAVRIHPGGFNGWEQLGLAYIKLRQYPQARAAFVHCLRINPGQKGSLQNVLHIAQKTHIEKHYRESLVTYQMLLDYEPDSARNYFGMGLAYKNLAVYDSSVAWLNKTLEMDPDYCDAYGKLGEIFGQNFNDLVRSEDLLRKAIACNPRDASALENLGIIHGIRRNFAASIDYFMQAYALNPDDLSLNRNIAMTYLSMGHPEKAGEFRTRIQELEAKQTQEE